LLATSPATAQDIRVNVTGSNIKRVDTETAAPIETITREAIQQSGYQTIPKSCGRSPRTTTARSPTSGVSDSRRAALGVSLRGLGSNNTLVLLNGRRLANYGLADDGHYSFVDLNQVPFDAVERIEILKDGASAIYGSDAVAGVVNVILRQQYTGFTANATAGTSYKGDGNQYRGALTWGMGDLTKDRYNFFVTVDAQKQEEMPVDQSSPVHRHHEPRVHGPARYATRQSARWDGAPRARSAMCDPSRQQPHGPAARRLPVAAR
jgi:iron complex outermembrane receptor protein